MHRCEKQGVMEGREGCREGGRDGKMDGRKERGEAGERVVWLLLGVVRRWSDNKLQMEATAPLFTCIVCVCVCISLNDL